MRILMFCLVLGVMPAFGGARDANSAPVTLYTHFQQEPAPPLVEAIEDELEAIMSPAGVRFEWYPLSDAGGRVSTQLAVIHFKGECDASGLRSDAGYPGPLGWTHISDGEILPFIDVNCDGLRLFVQRDLIGMPFAKRDEVLGRAIARILAHELYHLLAHTKEHAGKGIAKAAYSVEELLAGTLQFGKKECASLRSHAPRTIGEPSVQGQ